jgi:metal-dependent amidase/aminoacylase/carboxypeptidase family protein
MGVAEAMAAMRDDLPGTVKFIFQPAEEGPPEGEEGGAELMMKEGVLTDPAVEAALALHIAAEVDVGKITYRPGPAMASVQDYRIVVKGRQSHGAAPWMSVDPVVTGSQIVMGLQTIVARNLNITELPAIVTVVPLETGAEDFAFFAEDVPSFYYFLGGKPLDVPASEAASHHTPDFFIDESGLALGVESMLAVALDYLNGANPITEQ